MAACIVSLGGKRWKSSSYQVLPRSRKLSSHNLPFALTEVTFTMERFCPAGERGGRGGGGRKREAGTKAIQPRSQDKLEVKSLFLFPCGCGDVQRAALACIDSCDSTGVSILQAEGVLRLGN